MLCRPYLWHYDISGKTYCHERLASSSSRQIDCAVLCTDPADQPTLLLIFCTDGAYGATSGILSKLSPPVEDAETTSHAEVFALHSEIKYENTKSNTKNNDFLVLIVLLFWGGSECVQWSLLA